MRRHLRPKEGGNQIGVGRAGSCGDCLHGNRGAQAPSGEALPFNLFPPSNHQTPRGSLGGDASSRSATPVSQCLPASLRPRCFLTTSAPLLCICLSPRFPVPLSLCAHLSCLYPSPPFHPPAPVSLCLFLSVCPLRVLPLPFLPFLSALLSSPLSFRSFLSVSLSAALLSLSLPPPCPLTCAHRNGL